MDAGTVVESGRETLLRRGLAVEAHLPGMLALEAADCVRSGEFADLNEFLLVAVGSFLDMRRHDDVTSLLQLRMMQAAIATPSTPRTFAQGRADVLARLGRPVPMSAGEAVAAVA